MLQLVPDRKKIPFEQLYEENFDKVVGYIYRKLGAWEDSEDLASEVFLYCHAHYDSYDPEKSSPTTWLYLVVNSRLKNHYRDAKTYVDLESLTGELQDDSVDMEQCVYLEQVRRILSRALEHLPERQRRIVEMRYFQDMSGAEIAEAMHMTPGNVRVQLSRALDALEPLCQDLL